MTTAVLKTIIIISTALYAGSLILWNLKKQKAALWGWSAAWICSLGVVVNNFIVNHYVPFVSMYQILTFSAVLFGLVYLYTRFCRNGAWTAPYFIGCSLFVSIGLCFMDAQAVWHFAPALNSPWFTPHILMYLISYVMGAVAFLMMMVKVCRTKESRLEIAPKIAGGIYDCVCVLFPCMTMGMFFGALWANEVWGGFWSWDIKEIWAMVTWLIWMCWLHFRRSAKLKKYGDILIAVGFIAVIVTFVFVRFMNTADSSMHAYMG